MGHAAGQAADGLHLHRLLQLASSALRSSSSRFRSVITSVKTMIPPMEPSDVDQGRHSQRVQSTLPSARASGSSSAEQTSPFKARWWMSATSAAGREDVVVVPADDVALLHVVLGEVAVADVDVAQVAVVDGDGAAAWAMM